MTDAECEVFDALKAAGADDGKALEAAKVVAAYNTWLQQMKGELVMLRWMVGANIALTLIVVGLVVLVMVHG